MNVLLTGGSGYIGSHTATVLSQAGHNTVLFDNLCNSREDVAYRLEHISGQRIPLVQGDVRNTSLLAATLREHHIDAVMHFAGLKAVSESVIDPLRYYDNNVNGTLSLLQAMQVANVQTLVFSSSATVYGLPRYLPYDESHPTLAINPYGKTKLMVEQMLADLAHSDPRWRIAVLRYFNPVGAHESGEIGEDPRGVPNNLMPFIAQVAEGRRAILSIFGNDYPTLDGTGVRDYVHVMDLAEGHLAALRLLQSQTGCHVFNLGAGQGFSVLEIVRAFEAVIGRALPVKYVDRRPGDLPEYYASVEKAQTLLGWKARRNLNDMCASTWKWQQNHAKLASEGA